ncbi:hypothetical protein J1N35_036505 [Gossypium stocksii]|uniref:Uncharacterized protein n=1 Tax=Gossypium stocksii TaxID=47602 RepID=A0A9D3ZK05_9ROSI|nr:hypothetical protein J1N35_036505 [Gossypium stocksii]
MIAVDPEFGDMTSAEDARSQNNNMGRATTMVNQKKPGRILIRTKRVRMKEIQKAAIFGMKNQRNGVVLSTDAPTLDGPLFGSLSTGSMLVPEWISMAAGVVLSLG